MKAVTLGDGIKVYNLSSGKTLPGWLAEKRKKALKKDEHYRRRVELLQDFDFPMSSTRVRVTKDGQHIAATGTYPPSLKMFDVQELSMKFERRLDSEAVDMVLLGSDYGKLALLHEHPCTVAQRAQHLRCLGKLASSLALGSRLCGQCGLCRLLSCSHCRQHQCWHNNLATVL